MKTLRIGALVALGFLVAPRAVVAEEANDKNTARWLEDFSRNWDESKWEKSFRTAAGGFMRPLGDEGWSARMRALHGVVAQGKRAIPDLLEAIKDKNTPRRIFAAQALGYLAPDVPTAPLLHAAQHDPDAAVRLYAVDALGMKGEKTLNFSELLKNERNGDVRKHGNYAKERQGSPVDPALVQQLVDWDSLRVNSAVLGQPAPDFELRAATGQWVKLSNYKGKSAVVLVFIYGDT